MGCWIVKGTGFIACTCHDGTSSIHDNGPDRHFTTRGGLARFFQRNIHMAAKSHSPDCTATDAFASAGFTLSRWA